MTVESELQRLALERAEAYETAISALDLGDPARVYRQIRAYLAELEDHGRIKRFRENMLPLRAAQDGVQELRCVPIELTSGSRFEFTIKMRQQQGICRLIEFEFHLNLPPARNVDMVRIHLIPERPRDPLQVPQCHMHIGGGERAHVPFPIMSPRLILHLVCEVIEPDIGV